MLQYSFPGHWVDMDGKNQGRPVLRKQLVQWLWGFCRGVGRSHQHLFFSTDTCGGIREPRYPVFILSLETCLCVGSGCLLFLI